MAAARLRNGPNVTEIILGAVLSLLLGTLLATVYLVLKPVPVLAVAPKEKDKDAPALYYLEGRKGFAGNGWMLRREAFLRGEPIKLTEDEANAWIQALYPSTPTRGGEPVATEAPMMQPGTPNLRLADNSAFLGTILKLDLFGWTPTVVAQSRGTFAMRGGKAKFVPDTLYIGSFPAHQLPMLRPLVFGRLTGMWKFPEDLSGVWEKLGAVRLEKNQLVLEPRAG